ncbi:MAG TPA: aldo/keto reductase [Bryobacteraceae bacterium]|nr:aldo/keto reductase [Bryobacteraceae bacterium]
MLSGRATREATASYSARFAIRDFFYRNAQSLTVSSVGIGTYLGGHDDATTHAYTDAITAAVELGINVIDTSLNYRHQRSEFAVRAALVKLQASGRCERDELVICTKAGYLVPGAVPEMLREGDVAGGMHSIAPGFLADQLERSRGNLGLAAIDIFYLHNPETQLAYIDEETFYVRMQSAFEQLEHMAAQGRISFYGTATWEGYRRRPQQPGALSLPRLEEMARQIAGDDHHFRFVQLPFNVVMQEAATLANQFIDDEPMTVLEAARRLGITVIASASLLQARLAGSLPENGGERFPGLATDAQRAIQFVRSTPGITTALVGMSRPEHVYENVGAAQLSARDA